MGRDNENPDRASIGYCPECEGAVPRGRLLARYVTSDTHARVLAECPECALVVAPV